MYQTAFFDIAHFIKRHQKTMYFQKFMDGITTFPLGRGHCLISSQCKSSTCYTFVKDQQLESSSVAQIMKKAILICQNCGAELNQNTLVIDISLRALFERNFTTQRLNQVSYVTISPNFSIEVQQQQKWQALTKSVNNIRLKKLTKYEEALAKDQNLRINIDTKNIYQSLNKTNQHLKKAINQTKLLHAKSNKNLKTIEFCLYEAKIQPKIIHYEDNTVVAYAMQDFKYENRNKADCSLLGFDKQTKNIFYFDGDSRNKSCFHSNILKHANRERGSLKLFRIGKYQTQGLDHIITGATVHVINNVVYIVGGRANTKPLKEIFFCNFAQYALQKDQEVKPVLKLYATMNQPRLYSGTDIIYINNKPNLIVFGGVLQQQNSRWNAINDVQLIQLHPQIPNGNVVKLMKSYLPCLGLSTIAAFQQDKIVIFGGHESVMNDFRSKQNKNIIIGKIDFVNQTCQQISRSVLNNFKPLRFGELGIGRSSENQIVFLRKQQAEDYSKLTVTYINQTFSGLNQTIRP